MGPIKKLMTVPMAISQLLNNEISTFHRSSIRDLFVDDFIKLIKKILLSKNPTKVYTMLEAETFHGKTILEKLKN